MRSSSSRSGKAAERIALTALFALVLAMGAFNSALRTDAHHWGLMLSNAIDLSDGKVPYRDFIIQYGYFTTLVQSLWGRLFGYSFLALGILTATVYCGLLYQVYAIIRHLGGLWAAALFLAVAFILHPFPIYPWADYYAGFFLSGAMLLLYTRNPGTAASLITAGVLLGLAVWSRYTYAVAIVPFLFAVLIAGRYSLRGWSSLLLSFVATNLLFLALFRFGYGLDLTDTLRIYSEMADGHGTDWLSIERIGMLLLLTRVEDGWPVYLWLATLPLFIAAARNRQLSGPEVGAYVALSVLGAVNLIHAIRLFEYFRVINASFPLLIVSFWMIGHTARAAAVRNHADTWRKVATIGFFQRLPLLLVVVLLMLAVFSVRALGSFPLNTDNSLGYPLGHDPEIWRSTRGLRGLTHGKVGRVNFHRADMLAFYRALAPEICGHSRVFNFTPDLLARHVCDPPISMRTAHEDALLHLIDRTEYQKLYVRGEFSGDDAVMTIRPGYEGFLCLVRQALVAPRLEYVAKAGTRYLVRSQCVGKLHYGEGWSQGRRWALSERAVIHLVNHRSQPLRARLALTLRTLEARTVTISLNDRILLSADLTPGHPVSLSPWDFRLLPGDNRLSFDGDAATRGSRARNPPDLTFNIAIDTFDLSAE